MGFVYCRHYLQKGVCNEVPRMTLSQQKPKANRAVAAFLFTSCLVALYALFRFNPLFFHTIVEGYSIILSSITYVLATKTYKFSQNGLLRFLGFSCMGFAILKGFHLVTYQGIGLIQPADTNVSVQFWIAARFLESLVFIVLPFFARRTFSNNRMEVIFGIFAGMMACIIFFKLFPPCFSAGKPLPILFMAETIITLMLIAAFSNFRLHRKSISPQLYRPLVLSLLFSIGAEVCNVSALNSWAFLNFLSHLLHALSAYQIYRGIVARGLELPFQTIFAELKETAMTDPLTGLLNRSGFNETARKKLGCSIRDGRRFGLLYLDVDNFKLVNDRFGHLLGDEVLKEIAQLLQSAIRGQDTACRMGGDEFAIIADAADREQLTLISNRIERSFSQRFRLRPSTRILGISIGMAVWSPGDSPDINQLIHRADDAMYQSKKINKTSSTALHGYAGGLPK